MEFSTEYLTSQDIFFQEIIDKVNVLPLIYLLDFDNEHGEIMFKLLKNPLYPSLDCLPVKWIKLNTLQDFVNELHNIKILNNQYIILCIPFSWDIQYDPVDIEILECLKILSEANSAIIIAAGDEKFNETLQDIAIIADKYIEWGTNINEHDEVVTGTSAYSALLSLLAIGGKGYLNEKKEIIDKDL